MQDLLTFLALYRELIIGLCFVLLTVVIVYWQWERVRVMLMNFSYDVPLIGRSARLRRGYSHKADPRGWFKAEKSLCADYRQLRSRQGASPDTFDVAQKYLSKAGEVDRRPMPWVFWPLIVLLLAAEAFGFGYVLAGYTIPGASERMVVYGSYVIATVLALICVGFTHAAGAEIYRNGIVRALRDEWKDDRARGRTVNFHRTQGDIPLDAAHNDRDDGEPPYIQALNRLAGRRTKPSWTVTTITCLFVIAIAAGSTYVRGKVVERQMEEAHLTEQTLAPDAGSGFPADVDAAAAQAQDRALTDVELSTRAGAWGTFLVLAVIFIFLQILSTLIGIKYGFAAKKSPQAWTITHRFHDREHYEDHLAARLGAIDQAAEARLARLQRGIADNLRDGGGDAAALAAAEDRSAHTFEAYLDQAEEARWRREAAAADPRLRVVKEGEAL